jgi:hypothetical protein
MASYHTFTTTRTTEPDFNALLDALKVIEPTAGYYHEPGSPEYRVKSTDELTDPQVADMQVAIDTAVEPSEKTTAKAHVDKLSLFEQALAIVNLDMHNHTRSKLVPALPPISQHDYKQAIKNKVDELADNQP